MESDFSPLESAISYKFLMFQKIPYRERLSVMTYFSQLKIDCAKRMLRESNLSVTQIADKLSFDSPNYFSKTFKKLTGFTPLQYKKLHKR